MSNTENDPQIDQQLESLQDQAGELIKPCKFASSSRLYGELRRKAKAEQRAYHYVMGTFFQMDQAQYLLDFQRMRERAVELIALLEDEERIRQIQADFPIEHYENLVYSMSSCAYENLAEATGQLEGYNSEGMHACIADGIQICRRTGKLGCIGCFREYACDVYMAADDPDIAMHQCRQVTEHDGAWSDRGDRRWVASGKAGWLDALHGRYEQAIENYRQALEFTQSELVSLKTEARLRTLLQLDTVLIAAGRKPMLEEDPVFTEMPTGEECPMFELSFEQNRALMAAMNSDWDTATEILTRWDQRLQKCGGTHLWFETRLRLIAVKRLAGQRKQAEALAKQLEQKARSANDWLTLRRLDVLMATNNPTALAVLNDSVAESTATGPGRVRKSIDNDPGKGTAVSNSTAPESDTKDAAADEKSAMVEGVQVERTQARSPVSAETDLIPETDMVPDADTPDADTPDADMPDADMATDTEPATPLAEFLAGIRERMNDLMSDPTEEKFQAIRNDVLAVDPSMATDYDDAAGLIHVMGWLVGPAKDGEEIWKWANAIAAPHRDQGLVLSVLGALGDSLRNSPNEQMAEKITAERTVQLLRKALELDGNRPRNHMRAGDHFLRENNHGEAERCFARAFRLDRTLPDVVERLADLYTDTDRPRDALHVLDLSLREGCTESRIAFNAAMLAFRLNQYDSTLTYLERFETLGGSNRGWVCYYRSVCHFELQHFDEALMFTDLAEEAAEGTGWHLEAMRAAVLSSMGRVEKAKPHFDYVMDTPLHEIDFLSAAGISSLLERLLNLVTNVTKDQAWQERIESRLLRSGLMPDWWFQQHRDKQKEVEGVRLYRCLLYQPLDDRWKDDSDRLNSEAEWTAYGIEWGILAESEENAVEIALKWQSRCHHLEAHIEETLVSNESYTDSPGVVWQSGRFAIPDDDDESMLSDDDDDDDEMEDDFDDEFDDEDDQLEDM